ncbi:ATP-binding protein [Streptomyces sp. H10-C2]|uniref:ATP-binding protein n=1 Tax=unclassified Streptomyces TaxID=2593676 RepID=UPI0024B98F89|nr:MULTISPECIES: ATP-binding protein [unclassified Streptomyces]MDJ0342448.1 ATP-binding protein [Streptomyces sp. PH10-H1]MDJ0372303.1 ATP-binding protein [Streptomyces sp. H10-C2]
MQVLQVQLEVGADPAEVGRARRWARSRLLGSGIGADEPLAETLILLISELVTNAVVHTGCPAVLRMLFPDSSDLTVRVEVADSSDCPPTPRHAHRDETGGRGLELVDGLADRWGWQPEGAGKRIWCEVDRPLAGQGIAGLEHCDGCDRTACPAHEGLGRGIQEELVPPRLRTGL